MLGATGFLAETANNFPSTLTKVCPHCSRSDGSKAEVNTLHKHPLPLPTLQTGTAQAVPNGARATLALFQRRNSPFASSHALLENERGGNLQHVKGNLEGGCQVSQALSRTMYRTQQYSTTGENLGSGKSLGKNPKST